MSDYFSRLSAQIAEEQQRRAARLHHEDNGEAIALQRMSSFARALDTYKLGFEKLGASVESVVTERRIKFTLAAGEVRPSSIHAEIDKRQEVQVWTDEPGGSHQRVSIDTHDIKAEVESFTKAIQEMGVRFFQRAAREGAI